MTKCGLELFLGSLKAMTQDGPNEVLAPLESRHDFVNTRVSSQVL